MELENNVLVQVVETKMKKDDESQITFKNKKIQAFKKKNERVAKVNINHGILINSLIFQFNNKTYKKVELTCSLDKNINYYLYVEEIEEIEFD